MMRRKEAREIGREEEGEREVGSEEDGKEGGREVVRRMDRKDEERQGGEGWRGRRGEVVMRRRKARERGRDEEGEREVVRRMGRKEGER